MPVSRHVVRWATTRRTTPGWVQRPGKAGRLPAILKQGKLPFFFGGGLVMYEDAVRDVLRGVLSSGSMLGARLRPLLVEEYRRTTTRDIEPVLKSFGKFSAFLAANADLVDVRSDDKSGDIRVSLKTTRAPQGSALQPSRRLSREIWQAFTNPDERRLRFYHRDTREIVHYLDNSSETLDKSLARRVSSDDKFIEIQFARAQDQNGWMREFLGVCEVPSSCRVCG